MELKLNKSEIKNNVMEQLRNLKFNGKIYGRKGQYTIYVNNQKVEVSDSQVEEYQKYLSEYESEKNNFPRILQCIEVQDISVELGIEKRFQERTLEQMKAIKNAFTISTVAEGEKHDCTYKVEKVEYEGKFVRAYYHVSNGMQGFLSESNLEDFLKKIV